VRGINLFSSFAVDAYPAYGEVTLNAPALNSTSRILPMGPTGPRSLLFILGYLDQDIACRKERAEGEASEVIDKQSKIGTWS